MMSYKDKIMSRANDQCELCGSNNQTEIFGVPPDAQGTVDDSVLICHTCSDQIKNPEKMDPNHWRCLNDSMWSETSAVKVLAWRMLNRLRNEGWPQDLLDMMYLEEEDRTWAEATGDHLAEEDKIIHKDSNGVVLHSGDSVVLIKDLLVKGGGFTAKRGTTVRRISLVDNNAEHIEGKVEGQKIVILTKYVKKN